MSALRDLYLRLRVSRAGMAMGSALNRALPSVHYVGDHTALVRTVFGQSLYVDTRDESIAPSLMFDGFWEKHVTRAYLKLLTPGATVVEIGANVGYFTTLAAARVGPSGRVYAFEANPHVAKLLERSVRLNGQTGWCRVIPMAVSERVGTARFYRMTREQGGSTLRELEEARLASPDSDVEVLQVPTVTLDAFIAAEAARVGIIKIDAEGAEPLIFKGMQHVLESHPRVVIIMEFAQGMLQLAKGGAAGFLADIERLGFNLFLIAPGGSLRRVSSTELLRTFHCDVVLRRQK